MQSLEHSETSEDFGERGIIQEAKVRLEKVGTVLREANDGGLSQHWQQKVQRRCSSQEYTKNILVRVNDDNCNQCICVLICQNDSCPGHHWCKEK